MVNPENELTYVVMAKRPEIGRGKTRLARDRSICAADAVEINWAMLRCVVDRLAACGEVLLAVSPDGAGTEILERLNVDTPNMVLTIDQGSGLLGERMDRIWRSIDRHRPIAFFGCDSPDVPDIGLEAVGAAFSSRGTVDVAVGPTVDGGYWTLAARCYFPQLLLGIDWGTEKVYDQTLIQAADQGLHVQHLPKWYDVDHPDDLAELRLRLARRLGTREKKLDEDPPLEVLARQLDSILGDYEGSDSLRADRHD